MVRYNLRRAKEVTVDLCRDPIPLPPIDIARELKKRVSGFYPRTPPKRVVGRLKKKVLYPLVLDGFLVEYKKDTPVWRKARPLVSRYISKKGYPAPRGLKELYQTSFLYLGGGEYPVIKKLPSPDKELNLDLVVLLSRFDKKKEYTWNMLNLLLVCSKEENREKLRLFLYKLPVDYDRIEILERVLEYGESYSDIKFPFNPDLENSKEFLRSLVG